MQISDFFNSFDGLFKGSETTPKKKFLKELDIRLSNLPKSEREKSLNFYEEIIDDKIEEGLTEQEAVESLGSIDEIAADILENSPVDEQQTTQRKGFPLAARIALLIFLSPLWLMVYVIALMAFLCVSMLGVMEIIFAGFAGCGLIQAVLDFIYKYNAHAVFCIGAALLGGGLGLILFRPFVLAMEKAFKSMWKMTVKFSRWLFGLEG